MLKETAFLMRTLLRMRSWRQIIILPIAIFCLFGIRLCHLLSTDWISTYLSREVRASHPTTFKTPRHKIGCDAVGFKNQCDSIRMFFSEYTRKKKSGLFANCKSKSTCFSQAYDYMLSNEKVPLSLYYVDFNRSTTICQSYNSGMIDCTFTGAAATLTKFAQNKGEDWFHASRTFQQIGLPKSLPAFKHSVCYTENSIFNKLPTAIMLQMMMLTAMVCVYTLLSTVSCMHELKSRGFLQLMMRKGLPPFVYWATVWIPIILEILLLSCCQAASFYLLCRGFFTLNQILYSSLTIAVYLLCTNAFVLLTTVLSNSYYTITKWVLLYMAVSMFSTLGNRLLHEFETPKLLKRGLLLLPWANVAEQIYANLSGVVIGTNYFSVVLLVNCLTIVVLGFVTIYLDNVLSTGNEMRYPLSYPFRRVPPDGPLPSAVAPSELVEFPEEPKVFVRIAGISPSHTTINRGSVSVDFYDDQIAAIYCEDAARNTWLLSALTGRVRENRGTVWVNGCVSSEPMSRLHSHTSLGECLQDDTLCHSLTVLHTLQMALVSSRTSWVESEMTVLLTLLRLLDTLDNTVGSLSTSQRRKLCIALALIGNPRLVILNDPTRGLDPLSRLRFWHLLQFYKPGRCIIVSTQFVDEIDVYADKKIFLSPTANSVLSAGSSKFLRRIAKSDAVLRFTLKNEDKSEAVIGVCANNMPLGGERSLDKNQLSIFLTKDAESNIPGLIRALRSVEKYILTVGLHYAQLSAVYNRLKDSMSGGVNSARGSLDSAGVGELLRPDNDVSMNSSNFKQVNSKRKSRKTCTGAVCGIFLFNFVLLYREWVRSVNKIILIVLLLAIHGAMHAMETTVTSAGSKVWINATLVPSKKFTRGFCVSDVESAPEGKIYNHACGLFFTGAAPVNNSFLSFQKPVTIDINTFLRQQNLTTIMYDHCNLTKEQDLPCPIVYSSNWYKGTYNHHREVAVGSFSRYGQYKPQKSIASIYTAYKTMLAYFSHTKPVDKADKLLIFIDFRNFQLNIYGVYSQMFISTVLPALFLDDIVEHKTSKWRSYLATVGVSSLSYWAGILPVHWLQCFVAYGLSVCISIYINPSAFLAVYQAIVSALTASLGLINNLMLVYLFTLFTPVSRYTFPAIYLLASVLTVVVSLYAQTTDLISDIAIALWPPFGSAALTYYSVKIYVYSKNLNHIGRVLGLPKMDTVFGQRQVFISLVAIPVQTAVLAIMLFVLVRLRPRMIDCRCKNDPRSSENEDEYVNVNNPGVVIGDQCAKIVAKGDCPILLKQLNKSYANGIEAVRSITLGVESKDLVAIVGPNASGLTTIAHSILGKVSPTKGRSRVQADGVCATGRNVASSGLIAYTPQWDPLFAAVTVKEHLRYYARVQGASADMALQLLKEAGLASLRNQPTGRLTHGQRRRLSVAISLLSCSPLLLIDDASTGMSSDEVAQLWRNLSKNFHRYSSGVLTAHSLAGAEAIECQVAIINQGLLDYVGTVEQFQQKHRMYIIELEFESRSNRIAVREKKISILQAVFKRFFSASVVDQTLTWVKVFVSVQGKDSQFDSLLWLLKLKEHCDIINLAFYPATADQTLELVYKNHDAEVQRRCEALVNRDAAPLSCLYESYDI